jgi:hypothetical protein
MNEEPRRRLTRYSVTPMQQENEMAGILMWLMGVPLVVIVLLYLIF